MAVAHITVLEAARRAEVHTRTVRRWLDEGRLVKYVTPTGRVRVDEEELASFLTPVAEPAEPAQR